jgi:uncharacterized protein YbjQ (UPF0145 family)
MTEESESQRAQQEAQEAAESQADLAHGGLPLQAQKRLAQEMGARPLFSTDLSVDEFLLALSEGYDAAGQVMGSSIYHVGWQYTRIFSGELTVMSQAHMHARELAMGRMQQEALALGAQGVIGVRLTTRAYEWGPDLLEFTAVGTAVRLHGGNPTMQPFLSDLSGEDFWTLVQAGYLPRGLAMGFCAYLAYRTSYQPGNVWGLYNQEVPEYSQAVYQARSLAMQRLRTDVGRLGADGVVGVKTDTSAYLETGDDRIPQHLRVDFLALGTAVVRVNTPRTPRQVTPVLNLTGLRPVRSRMEATELQEQ